MPRKAIIRPAIVEVLEHAHKPLRFTELRKKIQIALNRSHLDDKQLSYNLRILLDRGLIEKTMYAGQLAYRITHSYYEQEVLRNLISILNQRRPYELHDELQDEELPPHLVFINPPAYDYETKEAITDISLYAEPGMYGGGPMKRIGEFRYTPNWESPISAIGSVMLNDFNGLLDKGVRKGITELLRWSYWAGCRISIEGELYPDFAIPRLIEKNRLFALQCIEKFKENPTRVEVERTLIKILDLTNELVHKQNLAEFLDYYYKNIGEYRILLKRIISLESGALGGGERLLESFADFHSKVITGLFTAGLLEEAMPVSLRPYEEQFFLASSKVWNDLIEGIMTEQALHAYANLNEDLKLKKVCGSLEEAIARLGKMRHYLKPLLELPHKRQIAMIYLWGFPQIFSLSKRSFLPEFKEWMDALEKGNLDHRQWIFKQGIQAVTKALKAVKRGRKPSPAIIDIQRWTTRDIWEFHPHGKDPEFWEKILSLLKIRLEKLSRRKS